MKIDYFPLALNTLQEKASSYVLIVLQYEKHNSNNEKQNQKKPKYNLGSKYLSLDSETREMTVSQNSHQSENPSQINDLMAHNTAREAGKS